MLLPVTWLKRPHGQRRSLVHFPKLLKVQFFGSSDTRIGFVESENQKKKKIKSQFFSQSHNAMGCTSFVMTQFLMFWAENVTELKETNKDITKKLTG